MAYTCDLNIQEEFEASLGFIARGSLKGREGKLDYILFHPL